MSRFDANFKNTLPKFKPSDVKDVFGKTRVYTRTPSPDLSLFIRILPSIKNEKFTVEIGWSTRGVYPSDDIATTDPEAMPTNGGLHFRMSRLWQLTGSEKWWELSRIMTRDMFINAPEEDFIRRLTSDDYVTEGLANAPLMVDDAVSLIQKHVLPYFQRIVELHTAAT